jgi:Zn finger protein HypA/HybF involved in hydrogenase expression
MIKCKHCEKEIPNRNVFCNNFCQREFQYKETIKEWLKGSNIMNDGAIKISNNIRRYLFEVHNHKCQECSWDKVNPYTNKIPLEVEHIDGDSQNNKFENLKLLCPNCHSLTKTYKNIGSRKSTRIKRKK